MRFRGRFSASIDSGRLVIPIHWRRRLTESCDGRLVLVPWLVTGTGIDHRRIVGYPSKCWKRLTSRLLERSSDDLSRVMLVLLESSASTCDPDDRGRILLPSRLRDLAALDERVMLVGRGESFELWNEARHSQWAYLQESSKTLADGTCTSHPYWFVEYEEFSRYGQDPGGGRVEEWPLCAGKRRLGKCGSGGKNG